MRILDLFCGAGGAARGLRDAFPDAEIFGVDIRPQPRYPYAFYQADVMHMNLWALRSGPYDYIWASPPCQGYSRTSGIVSRRESSAAYPRLIEPLRDALRKTDIPYTIENVPLAPLESPVILCGQAFGLGVYRHRLFESSFPVPQPAHTRHTYRITNGRLAKYSGTWEPGQVITVAGHLFNLAAGRAAMQIDWMTRDELAEAVPPAYSRYVASFLPGHGKG